MAARIWDNIAGANLNGCQVYEKGVKLSQVDNLLLTISPIDHQGPPFIGWALFL